VLFWNALFHDVCHDDWFKLNEIKNMDSHEGHAGASMMPKNFWAMIANIVNAGVEELYVEDDGDSGIAENNKWKDFEFGIHSGGSCHQTIWWQQSTLTRNTLTTHIFLLMERYKDCQPKFYRSSIVSYIK